MTMWKWKRFVEDHLADEKLDRYLDNLYLGATDWHSDFRDMDDPTTVQVADDEIQGFAPYLPNTH